MYDLALWSHPWPWPWNFKVRVESEIAVSQEWDGLWTWSVKDVSRPFMTMILNSVIMVGWADVQDSDRGDFRRRRAIDLSTLASNDDVSKWKHFPRYWPFLRGIHLSLVNSPQKGQWREAMMFSLICAWINGWVNNREAGDLRRHRAHYNVIVLPMYHGGVNVV